MLIHKLIKASCTGKPKELASIVGVSERTIYNYIRFIKKDLNAPLKWNANKVSYVYEKFGDINFDWRD